MATEILSILARVNLAAAAAIVLVLMLRRPVRAWFGSRATYGLWLAPALAAAAVLVPGLPSPLSLRLPTPAVSLAPLPARPGPAILAAAGASKGSEATFDQEPATPPPGALGHELNRPATPTSPLDLPTLALAGWIVGTALSPAFLFRRQRRFLTALGTLTAVNEAGLTLHRAQTGTLGPAVVGLIRPRIVIPADFETRFTPEERRVVLAHERVHIAHQDSRINGLAGC